jgi:hypothetical protein
MRDYAYVEGRQFDITYLFADGYTKRLPGLAGEVVRLGSSVILAPASGPAVAAKNATGTAGSRRRRAPGTGRERGTTRRQCHRDCSLCGGTARKTDRTCEGSGAGRLQNRCSRQPE